MSVPRPKCCGPQLTKTIEGLSVDCMAWENGVKSSADDVTDAGRLRQAGFARLPSLLFWLAVLAVGLYLCRYSFIRPPAPTPAGFGTVRWGMTLDEVRDAEPFPPVRAVSSALAYDTTVLGRPCRVAYAFHNGELDAARLQFSAPGVAKLPVPTQRQALQTYHWLKTEISSRYNHLVSTNEYPREHRTTRPREEVAAYETRLVEAQRHLEDRRHQLRNKYSKWRGGRLDVEKRIQRELAEDSRHVEDLERWLRETREADRDSPLVSRLETEWELATWDGRAMRLALYLDYMTSPPGVGILYKTNPARRPIPSSGEL